MRLLNLRMTSTEWVEAKLQGVSLTPKKGELQRYFGNLLRYSTGAMLHLNDCNVDAARAIAREFVSDPIVKGHAEGMQDEYIHDKGSKDYLQFSYFIMLKVAGDRDEATRFHDTYIPHREFNTNFKARRWDLIVNRVMKMKNMGGDDRFLEIPYQELDADYFLNRLYNAEFAKMMLKKDWKQARSMLEKMKRYMEQLEDLEDIFYYRHFFSYVDMLEALAEVKPGATKLVKEYQQWKEHVGW